MNYAQSITRAVMLCALTLLTACASADEYNVELTVRFEPQRGLAAVTLDVTQSEHLLRKLDIKAPKKLFKNFKASAGKLERTSERVIWHVPVEGGTLQYTAGLNIPKGDGFDARITEEWALLRLEDLLPPLRATTRTKSSSKFKLSLDGPESWSYETRYGRWQNQPLPIVTPKKGFDRPTGWLIAGELGVRRESISGMNITVAAPAGSRYPRIPTLAFMRWTLPEFVKVFPGLPERILIVSGDESMWRGALSGPNSLFIHQGRPLISENATSTLLHELVHVASRLSAKDGADWIIEGLAEYYSLEILRRSDGLSQARFDAALEDMRDWVRKDKGKLADPSKGVDTAAAVLVFADLATELQADGKNASSLDALVQMLVSPENGRTRVSVAEMKEAASKLLGHESRVLQDIKP